MKTFFKFVLIALFLFLPLGLPGKSFAKDYTIGEVTIDVTIHPDRSFSVVEKRTYNFDGSFTWADMYIPTSITRKGYTYNVEINNFTVVDELGNPLVFAQSSSSDRFYAKWSYTAVNEPRTFTYRYDVTGEGVKKYVDTGDFYWQVIGDDWIKGSGPIEVLVHLPQSAPLDRLKVYGHGPLTGEVTITDGQTVQYTVPSLPANTYVEARVLFPQEFLLGDSSDATNLSTILAEENSIREETIGKLKKQQLLLKIVGLLIILGHPLLILIWLLCYFRAWKKYGKEYEFPNIVSGVYREIPSKLSPALVSSLLSQGGKPGSAAFVAEIFYLAKKGFITVSDKSEVKPGFFGSSIKYKTDLIKKFDYQKYSTLPGYQQDVIDMIFK